MKNIVSEERTFDINMNVLMNINRHAYEWMNMSSREKL